MSRCGKPSHGSKQHSRQREKRTGQLKHIKNVIRDRRRGRITVLEAGCQERRVTPGLLADAESDREFLERVAHRQKWMSPISPPPPMTSVLHISACPAPVPARRAALACAAGDFSLPPPSPPDLSDLEEERDREIHK